MKLSNNFTLAELTKSSTAERLGIDNTPNEIEIRNLEILCHFVLQPIRDYWGAVKVNSGFRCLKLNRAIGSKDNSQHAKGEAADIEVVGIDNWELAFWIRENISFDQLILEFSWGHQDYIEGNSVLDRNKGWCHVSRIAGPDQRGSILQINKDGVYKGLGRKRTDEDEDYYSNN